MQGRLSPPENGKIQAFPRSSWADEFPRAAEAGLNAIEWIFDAYGEDVNPICTDAGIQQLKSLIAKHGVQLRSLCADYFMDFPLLRTSDANRQERLAKLEWLFGRAAQVGVRRMVLPFVDISAMHDKAEETTVVGCLKSMLPAAEKHGIEMHLETDLNPVKFRDFLAQIPHPMVKVNYDSGNSSSLGYFPREEFDAYGDRVGSVHIKDRVRWGTTVPLTQGDCDFVELFSWLRKVNYAGDFVLQVARGKSGDEVAWSRANKDFVVKNWSEQTHGSAAQR